MFGCIILNILAHLAHWAQSYFSLIFSAINTYNYFCFDLSDKSMVKSDQCFFPHGDRRHYWYMVLLVYLLLVTGNIAITGISIHPFKESSENDRQTLRHRAIKILYLSFLSSRLKLSCFCVRQHFTP